MMILEFEGVEVDYCATCAGVWLDAGELNLLFGDRTVTAGFLSGGTPAAGEGTRRCPACRKKMQKQATSGPEPVTYDACPRGDGLWFDEGELGAVLKHGSPVPGGDAVAGWLHGMFDAPEDTE